MIVDSACQDLNVLLFLAGLFLDESIQSCSVCENMLRPLFIHLYFETESLFLLFDKFLQVRSLDIHAKLDLLVEKLMTLVLWSKLQLL